MLEINKKGEVKLEEACSEVWCMSSMKYRNLVKSHNFPAPKRGWVPFAEATRLLISYERDLSGAQGSEKLVFERKRLAKINADTKEFQYKIMTFKYINVDLAQKYWREVMIAIKNNIESTQSQLAKRLELCDNNAASYFPEILERDKQVLNECSEPELEQIARDEGDLPDDFVVEDGKPSKA